MRDGRTVSRESTSKFLAVLRLTGHWSAAALAADETVPRMKRLEGRDKEFGLRVFAAEVCFAARLATRPREYPAWSNNTVVRRRRDRIVAIAKAIRAAADGRNDIDVSSLADAARQGEWWRIVPEQGLKEQ